MEADEYPVVLLVGAESETGQVVLRPWIALMPLGAAWNVLVSASLHTAL